MPQDFVVQNLGIIFLVVFLWLLGVTFAIWKFLEQFGRLTKGTKSENLVKILEKILANTKQNATQLEKIEKKLQNLEAESTGHIQKVSLLRFNPFNDVGGDQSFVATFLDGENSGLIISSLHSRAGTRVYAKSVEKGQPKAGVRLSDEEVRSLRAAVEAK